MENKLKEQSDEVELNQNYDLWMSNKITAQQYFREVNRIKSK